MQKLFTAFMLLLAGFMLGGAVIVDNGKSDYEIIVRKDAPQATRFAATELQKYIAKSSGVKLAVRDKLSPGKKALYVGKNPAVKTDPAKFSNPEEYRVEELPDGSIAFVGQEGNGNPFKDIYGNFSVLYCVYDFLQRTTGVRWYAPGEFGECVEKHSKIESGKLPFGDKPQAWCRDYWPRVWNEFDMKDSYIFARRLRGFGLSRGGANHSMLALYYLYKDTKPEIFALQPDGKGRRFGKPRPGATYENSRWITYPQYCFTNPDTLKAYCDLIDAVYEKRPEAKYWTVMHPTNEAVYIVPNDNYTTQPCCCDNCRALIDNNSKGRGSMTPLVWGFVKKVAEYVQKKYPDKKVMTLAYEGYYEPPEFSLPDNVVVQICVNPYMIYMGAPAFRKAFDDQLAKWRKKVKTISIWHYMLPYDNIPYSMPNIMNQWVRDYPEIKAIFWEVTDSKMLPKVPRLKSHRATTAADLPQLHLNLYFGMLSTWENPVDVAAELERYYKLFYGPAAPAMKKFFDISIKQWENVKNVKHSPRTSYPKFSGKMLYEEIYSPQVIKVMKESLAQAEKLAGKDTIYRKRIQWQRDGFIDKFFISADAFAAEAKISRDQMLFPKKDKKDKVLADGIMDEKFYAALPEHSFVRTDAPLAPRYPSTFKVGISGSELIVGVRATDPDNRAARVDRTAHDGDVFMDDSIELFIVPDVARGNDVKNITVNLAGVIADYERLSSLGKGNDHKFESHARAAVKRFDDHYVMEIAIPLDKLNIKNNVFRMNVCRNKYSGVGENRERSVWSCTYGGFWAFGQLPYLRIVSDGTAFDDFTDNHWSYKTRMIPMDRENKRFDATQKGCKVIHKPGELTLEYTFDKDNLLRDYGNFNVYKLGKADMKGKPCVEIRFKNPDKNLNHLATYSFIASDGKRYGDYIRFCNNEEYKDFRTRKFNVATDGQRGRMRAKQGIAQPVPVKLNTLSIYSSSPARDGKKRTFTLDYVRVCE